MTTARRFSNKEATEFLTSERNPLLAGIFHTSQKGVPLCNTDNVPCLILNKENWLYSYI